MSRTAVFDLDGTLVDSAPDLHAALDRLAALVERDLTSYGDECCFGGGKVLRDGMGQAAGIAAKDALDVVITNALIVDWTGIYKADIGI